MKLSETPRLNSYSFLDYKKELDILLSENISRGVLPYNDISLYPENRNLITGESLCSLNAEKIELAAAKLDDNRALWIFGADAELLGLTLKKNENGLLLTAQTGKNKTPDYQYAYLIGQFTERSLERAYKLTNPVFSANKPNIRQLALCFIHNIREYDNDVTSIPARENYSLNAALNNKEGNRGKTKGLYVFNKIVSGLSKTQKYFFNNLRLKFRTQITGAQMPGIKKEIETPPNPHLSILKARLFALRMTLPDFGLSKTMPRFAEFEKSNSIKRAERKTTKQKELEI